MTTNDLFSAKFKPDSKLFYDSKAFFTISDLKNYVNYCKKYSYTEFVNSLDRWERTPLDDAKTGNHEACIKILESVLQIITE